MPNMTIENIHETRNYNLLEEVYHDILLPCFPDPEDHLTWKKMKHMVQNGIENGNENARVLISITKETKEDGTIEPISFIVGIYYKKSQTGLISYMGMKAGCKGITSNNLQLQVEEEFKKEAKRHDLILKAAFSIVDLPEHANKKYITLPPVLRIIMLERMGASHIPIDFYYPSFEKKMFPLFKKKIIYKNDAALLGYKFDDKSSTEDPAAIKDFLDDLYAFYDIDSSNNKIVKEMKKEIDLIAPGLNIKLSKAYKKNKTPFIHPDRRSVADLLA